MKRVKVLMGVALLIALAVLMYYIAITKNDHSDDVEKQTVVTNVTKVLSKDLENNYPKRAREVVTYFISIQECYYNETYTDKELVQLAYKAMELFDEELAEHNEFDEYYEALKDEIDAFKQEGKTITKTIVDKNADIEYSEDDDGTKSAKIKVIYYLKSGGSTAKVVEEYALRCDDNGYWKIRGWRIYQPSEYEE